MFRKKFFHSIKWMLIFVSAMMTLLVAVVLIWVIYLTSFSLPIIQTTIEYRNEVEILVININPELNYDVRLVWEHSQTCIITLVAWETIETNSPRIGGRSWMHLKFDGNNWQTNNSLYITRTRYDSILPTPPSTFIC